MQVSRFSNGGFVLHKINFNGHYYSAWYDNSGGMIDCERTTYGKYCSSIPPRCTTIRKYLNKLGKIWLTLRLEPVN